MIGRFENRRGGRSDRTFTTLLPSDNKVSELKSLMKGGHWSDEVFRHPTTRQRVSFITLTSVSHIQGTTSGL